MFSKNEVLARLDAVINNISEIQACVTEWKRYKELSYARKQIFDTLLNSTITCLENLKRGITLGNIINMDMQYISNAIDCFSALLRLPGVMVLEVQRDLRTVIEVVLSDLQRLKQCMNFCECKFKKLDGFND